jgi:hypothetical protein
MADERPQAVTLQGPVEIRIINEELPLRQLLTDPQGNPVGAAATGAGATSVSSKFVVDAAGVDRTALAEADATLRVAGKLEDPTGALVGPLSDAQQLLRQRGFEPWRWSAPTALAPGGGYSTIVTAPASTHVVIEYTLVATANNPLLDVHIVPNAGAPGVGNATFISAAPTVGALPYRDGPYVIEPGGTLQARNTAAAGNTGNIVAWVEYFSTGDTV